MYALVFPRSPPSYGRMITLRIHIYAAWGGAIAHCYSGDHAPQKHRPHLRPNKGTSVDHQHPPSKGWASFIFSPGIKYWLVFSDEWYRINLQRKTPAGRMDAGHHPVRDVSRIWGPMGAPGGPPAPTPPYRASRYSMPGSSFLFFFFSRLYYLEFSVGFFVCIFFSLLSKKRTNRSYGSWLSCVLVYWDVFDLGRF